MRVKQLKDTIQSLSTELFVICVTKSDLSNRQTKDVSFPGAINFKKLDSAFDKRVSRLLKKEGFEGKFGQSSLIKLPEDPTLRAVLITGWDDKVEGDLKRYEQYRSLGSSIQKQAKSIRAKKVSLSGYRLALTDPEAANALLEGLKLSNYNFTKYRKKTPQKYRGIEELGILSSKERISKQKRTAEALAAGTELARDLINTPAADCNPTSMVRKCREVGRKGKISVQVYNRDRLKRLKAGSLLSVAEGSSFPPALVKLTYRPKTKAKKVISIIGKGITFDTGGYSLKTPVGMQTMKCDMSGAAAVLGTMHAIATLKPKVEVRCYVPLAENMVNERATRPGDVVKAMNGKTIEVLNTDAEGRLILADALCLAEKDGCDVMIDLATLTGACMVALGDNYAGLFTRDEKLREQLVEAGATSGENLWPMPLADEYKKQLKSNISDVKNIGGRFGGAITAALFLEEFVSKTTWAHIDIAGPAWAEGENGYIKKGGVGFGVRTLSRYLMSL